MSALVSSLKYLTKPHTLRVVRGPASTTLSLFQQQSKPDLERLKEQFLYLKEYSYHDFSSRYKSWVELHPDEQEHFVSDYANLHQSKIVPKSHPNSFHNAIKQMDKENKDTSFLFFYLYEGLKDQAEAQYKKSRELVIMDDTYSLLVKRED